MIENIHAEREAHCALLSSVTMFQMPEPCCCCCSMIFYHHMTFLFRCCDSQVTRTKFIQKMQTSKKLFQWDYVGSSARSSFILLLISCFYVGMSLPSIKIYCTILGIAIVLLCAVKPSFAAYDTQCSNQFQFQFNYDVCFD